MDTLDQGAGFFGKVRSHGDFVQRRLPTEFLRIWDDWLQGTLRDSRHELGAGWLDTYLNSPIWRFALPSGVCGESAWAGVLMPSVDRVGRQFPLTIAAASTGIAPLLGWVTDEGAWYDRIETLALSTLHADFSLENFDTSLCSMTAPASGIGEAMPPAKGHVIALVGLDRLSDAVPRLNQVIATVLLQGHSLWWTDGSEHVAPCVLVRQGLPTAGLFTAMLDGRWAAYGGRVYRGQ